MLLSYFILSAKCGVDVQNIPQYTFTNTTGQQLTQNGIINNINSNEIQSLQKGIIHELCTNNTQIIEEYFEKGNNQHKFNLKNYFYYNQYSICSESDKKYYLSRYFLDDSEPYRFKPQFIEILKICLDAFHAKYKPDEKIIKKIREKLNPAILEQYKSETRNLLCLILIICRLLPTENQNSFPIPQDDHIWSTLDNIQYLSMYNSDWLELVHMKSLLLEVNDLSLDKIRNIYEKNHQTYRMFKERTNIFVKTPSQTAPSTFDEFEEICRRIRIDLTKFGINLYSPEINMLNIYKRMLFGSICNKFSNLQSYKIISEAMPQISNRILHKIIKNEWNFLPTLEILHKITDKVSLENQYSAISVFNLFELYADFIFKRSECYNFLIKYIDENKLEDVAVKFSHYISSNIVFSRSYEKAEEEITRQYLSINSHHQVKIDFAQKFKEITAASYNRHPEIGKLLKDFNKEDIKKWCNSGIQAKQKYEVLAMILHGLKLTFSLELRISQILVLIIQLENGGQNSFFQVKTGEGKTLIVACIALYKSLISNASVDIVTSSLDLAQKHSEDMRQFYELFQLKCYNLREITEGKNPEAKLSEKRILYGISFDYRSELLSQIIGEDNQKISHYKFCIIDEVDSLLLDSLNDILYISQPIPFISTINNFLMTLWNTVNFAMENVYEFEKGYLEVNKRFLTTSKTLKPGYSVKKTENYHSFSYKLEYELDEKYSSVYIKKIYYLSQYLKQKLELSKLSRILESENLPIHSAHHLKMIFDEYQKIPIFLRQFILPSVSNYIESAITSFEKQEGRDYVIKNGNIRIVDYRNTGNVEKKTRMWSLGLTAFLQMKHGLKTSYETVSAIFMSNLAFVRHYQEIVGLTGTIGDKNMANFLKKTFKVESHYIPEFKSKQYHKFNTLIPKDRNSWLSAILNTNIAILESGRAVLLMMESIKEVDEIEQLIREKNINFIHIRKYIDSKTSDAVKDIVKPGHIVIATNIAGRGTDIIASEDVERNGGLHVCITFLPKNKRVYDQNVGRTSRNGKRGTSQLIWLSSKGSIFQRQSPDDRANEELLKREKYVIRNLEERVHDCTVTDNLFSEFIKIYHSKKTSIEKKELTMQFGFWKETWMQNNSNYLNYTNDFETHLERFQRDKKRNLAFYMDEIILKIDSGTINEKDYKSIDQDLQNIDSEYLYILQYLRGFLLLKRSEGNAYNQDNIELVISLFKKVRNILINNIIPSKLLEYAMLKDKNDKRNFQIYILHELAILENINEMIGSDGIDHLEGVKLKQMQKINCDEVNPNSLDKSGRCSEFDKYQNKEGILQQILKSKAHFFVDRINEKIIFRKRYALKFLNDIHLERETGRFFFFSIKLENESIATNNMSVFNTILNLKTVLPFLDFISDLVRTYDLNPEDIKRICQRLERRLKLLIEKSFVCTEQSAIVCLEIMKKTIEKVIKNRSINFKIADEPKKLISNDLFRQISLVSQDLFKISTRFETVSLLQISIANQSGEIFNFASNNTSQLLSFLQNDNFCSSLEDAQKKSMANYLFSTILNRINSECEELLLQTEKLKRIEQITPHSPVLREIEEIWPFACSNQFKKFSQNFHSRHCKLNELIRKTNLDYKPDFVKVRNEFKNNTHNTSSETKNVSEQKFSADVQSSYHLTYSFKFLEFLEKRIDAFTFFINLHERIERECDILWDEFQDSIVCNLNHAIANIIDKNLLEEAFEHFTSPQNITRSTKKMFITPTNSQEDFCFLKHTAEVLKKKILLLDANYKLVGLFCDPQNVNNNDILIIRCFMKTETERKWYLLDYDLFTVKPEKQDENPHSSIKNLLLSYIIMSKNEGTEIILAIKRCCCKCVDLDAVFDFYIEDFPEQRKPPTGYNSVDSDKYISTSYDQSYSKYKEGNFSKKQTLPLICGIIITIFMCVAV